MSRPQSSDNADISVDAFYVSLASKAAMSAFAEGASTSVSGGWLQLGFLCSFKRYAVGEFWSGGLPVDVSVSDLVLLLLVTSLSQQ